MGRVVAAAAGAALVLGVGWCGGATAQVPGSYLNSCRHAHMSGSILNADCKGGGGRTYSTTIDTAQCHGVGVANTFGRLTCGTVQGSATQVGGGDDDDSQTPTRSYGNQGYGNDDGDDDTPPPPRRPRYGYRPPPPSYDDDDDGPPPPPRYGYRRPPPPDRYDDDDDD